MRSANSVTFLGGNAGWTAMLVMGGIFMAVMLLTAWRQGALSDVASHFRAGRALNRWAVDRDHRRRGRAAARANTDFSVRPGGERRRER
jgi:hypothetical protein